MLSITRVQSPEDLKSVKLLLTEYASIPAYAICMTGFEQELAELPGVYSLLLARFKEEAIGCVALNPKNDLTCEMKRLYIKSAFRGLGGGKALIKEFIVVARQAGYKKIQLETLPIMPQAISLYRSLGFVEKKTICKCSAEKIIFMELNL